MRDPRIEAVSPDFAIGSDERNPRKEKGFRAIGCDTRRCDQNVSNLSLKVATILLDPIE
jgi:hypothetical protein